MKEKFKDIELKLKDTKGKYQAAGNQSYLLCSNKTQHIRETMRNWDADYKICHKWIEDSHNMRIG
jgi:hypothetical protein